MCIFSGEVDEVSSTRIFARGIETVDSSERVRFDMQVLVYSMNYAAGAELAMVLPLPAPPGAAEDAVSFVNLERYPGFFQDLAKGFVPPSRSPRMLGFEGLAAGALAVHDVGMFEASFVPRMRDFERLDPRFRVSPEVWEQQPVYRDHGFAVFKLKATGRHTEHVHPMALVFPRRDPESVFFPTLHVHDEVLRSHADFDHVLYCQVEKEQEPHVAGWERSYGPAMEFVRTYDHEGLVLDGGHVWRRVLTGRFENRDCIVGPRGWTP